jgi:hypothetical protein
MPRVHGDGFLHINDIDYIIPYDEPILEFHGEADNEISQRIGGYVFRLIRDGHTIQVDYGSIPNPILSHLESKKRLGVHTELYRDQAFIPGEGGEYPEHLETYRTTKKGLKVFLRPIKIKDEPLLKEFIYSLSENSRCRRFLSTQKEGPHDFLQKLVIIDYTKQMAILAIIQEGEKEEIVRKKGFDLEESLSNGVYELKMTFKKDGR